MNCGAGRAERLSGATWSLSGGRRDLGGRVGMQPRRGEGEGDLITIEIAWSGCGPAFVGAEDGELR